MFNRYAYTENDPVNFIDPTGMLRCSGDDRCDTLHEAANDARSNLSDAQGKIDSLRDAIKSGTDLTAEQSETQTAVENAFGGDAVTSRRLGKISKKLGKMHDKIGAKGEGALVKFGGTATHPASAPLNGSHINIFDSFFDQPSSASYYISHEAGHLAGVNDKTLHDAPAGIGRLSSGSAVAYGRSAAKWLAQNNSKRARKNNDNYQCFVTDCGGP